MILWFRKMAHVMGLEEKGLCVWTLQDLLIWDGNSSLQRSYFKRNLKDVKKDVREEPSKERKHQRWALWPQLYGAGDVQPFFLDKDITYGRQWSEEGILYLRKIRSFLFSVAELHSSGSSSVEAWGHGSLARLNSIVQSFFSWVFPVRGCRGPGETSGRFGVSGCSHSAVQWLWLLASSTWGWDYSNLPRSPSTFSDSGPTRKGPASADPHTARFSSSKNHQGLLSILIGLWLVLTCIYFTPILPSWRPALCTLWTSSSSMTVKIAALQSLLKSASAIG